MRIAHWGLIILLALPIETASARQRQQTPPPSDQQQTDSLAAAARRTQEQRKDQKKAAKVWDNDNLPTTPSAVSVVGTAPAPAADATTTVDNGTANPPAQDSTSGAPGTPDKLAEHVDVGAMQAQLKDLKTDLDILQRKYTLDQANYYGKTNYAADKNGAAALDEEKADIEAKQQEIDAIQSKLDSLH